MHQIFNIFLADGQLLIYFTDAVSPSIRCVWVVKVGLYFMNVYSFDDSTFSK